MDPGRPSVQILVEGFPGPFKSAHRHLGGRGEGQQKLKIGVRDIEMQILSVRFTPRGETTGLRLVSDMGVARVHKLAHNWRRLVPFVDPHSAGGSRVGGIPCTWARPVGVGRVGDGGN